MDLKDSLTKQNLMRAFAGESQARNRYEFAAQKATSMHQYVLAELFRFTARQEEAHAKIFYEHLLELNGENIDIDAGYPVNLDDDLLSLLKVANHNETEEAQDAYPEFAQVARDEGFNKIALDFDNIAKIEAHHAQRFQRFADLLENQELYKSEEPEKWICLHCGHIHEGKMAPKNCPVCTYEQGHFVRLSSLGEQ